MVPSLWGLCLLPSHPSGGLSCQMDVWCHLLLLGRRTQRHGQGRLHRCLSIPQSQFPTPQSRGGGKMTWIQIPVTLASRPIRANGVEHSFALRKWGLVKEPRSALGVTRWSVGNDLHFYLSNVCVFLCICAFCIYVCVCTCVHMHIIACMWRSVILLSGVSLGSKFLYNLRHLGGPYNPQH